MFYRQSILFVAFIEKEHPVEFRKFLLDVENGMALKSAFMEAFETDTATKWKEFKEKITS